MYKCILTDGPYHGKVLEFARQPYEIDAVDQGDTVRFFSDPINLFGPSRSLYFRDEPENAAKAISYKYSGTL